MSHKLNSNFKDQLANLKHIHGEVAAMRNGILRAQGREWEEYSPSDFLYSFVIFNTLYNINWEKSISIGELKRYREDDKRLTEPKKQGLFLSFCFKDDDFVELFKWYFINFILKIEGRDKAGTINILQSVRFGDNRKELFLNYFEDLLSGIFNQEVLSYITHCLYLVRCNIFHGSKSIRDLRNAEQQSRLVIYTSFLIALNQMVFSYLSYMDSIDTFPASIERDFHNLLENNKMRSRPTVKHRLSE